MKTSTDARHRYLIECFLDHPAKLIESLQIFHQVLAKKTETPDGPSTQCRICDMTCTSGKNFGKNHRWMCSSISNRIYSQYVIWRRTQMAISNAKSAKFGSQRDHWNITTNDSIPTWMSRKKRRSSRCISVTCAMPQCLVNIIWVRNWTENEVRRRKIKTNFFWCVFREPLEDPSRKHSLFHLQNLIHKRCLHLSLQKSSSKCAKGWSNTEIHRKLPIGW